MCFLKRFKAIPSSLFRFMICPPGRLPGPWCFLINFYTPGVWLESLHKHSICLGGCAGLTPAIDSPPRCGGCNSSGMFSLSVLLHKLGTLFWSFCSSFPSGFCHSPVYAVAAGISPFMLTWRHTWCLSSGKGLQLPMNENYYHWH